MFSYTLRYRLPSKEVHPHAGHIIQTSPGKVRQPSSHVAAAFTAWSSGSIGLSFVLQTRPLQTASYTVPVRQLRILPQASFRFCVTADTLAIS